MKRMFAVCAPGLEAVLARELQGLGLLKPFTLLHESGGVSFTGKIAFGAEKLADNAKVVLSAILRAKPASAKGNYVEGVTLCTTMGPGVKIDLAQVRTMAA